MGHPRLFALVRRLPVAGRIADWGIGPHAVSRATREAGARWLEAAKWLARGGLGLRLFGHGAIARTARAGKPSET